MTNERKFILKLLTALLLLHYGLKKTNAISQYKPQQAAVQPRAQQIQQNLKPQQQMQKQSIMQQNAQMQQQPQQEMQKQPIIQQNTQILHQSQQEKQPIMQQNAQTPQQSQQQMKKQLIMQQNAQMQQQTQQQMQKQAIMQQNSQMLHQSQQEKQPTMQQNAQMPQQSQQQIQKQPIMQQNPQIQQQSQQTITQTTSTVQEKEISNETTMEDPFQEPDVINHFKMMNDLKRENYPQAPFPSSTHQIPQIPPMPSIHSFPSPTWNPNTFMNQGFGVPQAYTATHSYPMPTYGMHPFASHTFSGAPYQAMPFFGAPKFFPFPMGYPQQVFMPYPPLMPSDFFYAPFSGSVNDFEDTTSRAANVRRPPLTNGRDSPIYYMRIPPTPYMFMPNFGYPTNQNGPSFNYGANFPSITPFQNFPTYPGLGQTYNLPLNFLANGKPTGIHSFIPNIQNSSPFPNFNGFNQRPLGPHPSGNYFQPPYNSPPPPPSYQDSKLTSLKQPFFFNGRPEDIYVLQNTLNPLFSGL